MASTTFATAQIAAILSDGIGPEVIAASREVFKVCAERDGGFELEHHAVVFVRQGVEQAVGSLPHIADALA